MHLLIVTSFFAGCLALHNACSRYLLAMGRARILPVVLAKVSPTTGTPSVAGIVQGVLVFVAIAGFALTPADPYTEVVLWTNTPTIIAVLALQILTSIAVVRFFSTGARGEGLWQRLIAPSLAAVSLVVALRIPASEHGHRDWVDHSSESVVRGATGRCFRSGGRSEPVGS